MVHSLAHYFQEENPGLVGLWKAFEPIKQEHNDYVVVCNEEGESTFKQLKKYGKIRVLHPLNPKYEDIELDRDIEYRIVGVVMEKKKRYR